MRVHVLAELVCLCASFCLWVSIRRFSQKSMLIWQNAECVFNIFGIILLGGVSGAAMYAAALVRNLTVLANLKRLGWVVTWGVVVLDVALGILTFQVWYDVFPILATVEYTLLLQRKEIVFTKKNLLVNLILWEVYALCLGGLVMIATYFIMVLTSLVDLICLTKRKEKGSG